MKRPFQITSIVLLFVAGFVGLESWNLKFYTSLGPGNGFFPLCLAIFLAFLAVFMFCQATFGRATPMPDDFAAEWPAYRKMGAVAVALVAAIILLEPLGFCLTMLGFYVFLLRVLGSQNWAWTVGIALGGSFGMYFVFVHWLSTPLPSGLLNI
jgi:putative tricarboxylic transport membrane protein